MPRQADLLPGTLDVLILKSVSLGPLHGYAVLGRIEQITQGALLVEQGALYPALYRLEHQGLLATEWGTSENNRRASTTASPPPGENVSARKPTAGTVLPSRCRRRSRRARPRAEEASC